jgi:hypothetical protein
MLEYCNKKLSRLSFLRIFVIENNNEFLNFLMNIKYERKNWIERRYYLDLS